MVTEQHITEATQRVGDARQALVRESSTGNSVAAMIAGLGVDEEALGAWASLAIEELTRDPREMAGWLPAALVNGFLCGVIAGRLESAGD